MFRSVGIGSDDDDLGGQRHYFPKWVDFSTFLLLVFMF